MKKIFTYILFPILCFTSCGEDNDDNLKAEVSTTFSFTHNWDGQNVTNNDFNDIKFTNQNGDMLSIERLRYVISDITFTGSNGEQLSFDVYNLVDVTNDNGLIYNLQSQIPVDNYTNVSFTFGLDNEDNSENYLDLNSESFNVPDMLGGGYHYMQFDGKYINSSDQEEGFNYHAIRAVDNPGMNPTFPQDTFFTVNLGAVNITNNAEIEVKANLAEWFRNPNIWDLNVLNTVLMPNASAQIKMFENGQSVFSLGDVTQ